ncbi:MAG: hypothetical protein PHQ52_04455, partial [Candidatus Omnitrophica bacterium]|nr:hypothetical protein [Candidatus Omnitrophota bacterium]
QQGITQLRNLVAQTILAETVKMKMVDIESREIVFGITEDMLNSMPVNMQIALRSMGVRFEVIKNGMTPGEIVDALRTGSSDSAEFFILGRAEMFEEAGMMEALAGLKNVTMMTVRDQVNWATALGCFVERTAYCEMFANKNQQEKIEAMRTEQGLTIENVAVVDVSGQTDEAFLSDLEANLAY